MRRYCLTIEPRARPGRARSQAGRPGDTASHPRPEIQRIGSAVPGRSMRTARPSLAQFFEQSLDRPEQLGGRQVAECPQRFGHLLGRARGQPAAAEAAFDPPQRLGIEQPRRLRCFQQGVQQVLVNGRPARPQVAPPRLVPLVEIARRELKDQLRGERRGDLALPGDDPHRPRADFIEQASAVETAPGPDRGIRERSRRRSGNRETCPRPGAGPWPAAAAARAGSAWRDRAGA